MYYPLAKFGFRALTYTHTHTYKRTQARINALLSRSRPRLNHKKSCFAAVIPAEATPVSGA